METWEMIKMLKENPKRIAESRYGLHTVKMKYGNLVFIGNERAVQLDDDFLSIKWKIIEPEPGKVDTLTALKAFANKKAIMSFKQEKIYCETRPDCKGCKNNRFDINENSCNNYCLDDITEKEINDNEWIIFE